MTSPLSPPSLDQADARRAQLESVNAELRARNRQQATLAALGQAAILARDPQPLIHEAVAELSHAIGTQFGAVSEILHDTAELHVRAGVGWNADLSRIRGPICRYPIAAYMLDTDASLVISDARNESRFPMSEGLRENQIVSAMAVFIRGRHRPWGVLFVGSREHRSFTTDDVDFLQSVANILSLTIERHELETARQGEGLERERLLQSETEAKRCAEKALDRLRAMQSITDNALQSLELDDLLRELLCRLRTALDADFASVALIDEAERTVYVRAAVGDVHERAFEMRSPLGTGVSGKIAADGVPRIVNGLTLSDLAGVEGAPHAEILDMTKSVMGVPLQVAEKIIGVVTVASGRPRHFTDEDLELLAPVAARAAPAVEQARLTETARAAQERLSALSRRVLTAHEEERRRLAVELHDDLGQVLTAVKINLESLQRRPGSTPSTHLIDAIGSVDQAMQWVRNLALDLRPSVLDDVGLAAALRWYVDRFARQGTLAVHLSIDAAVSRLEPALETGCFRLAQEALTNIARHAQARHVWFDLHLFGDALELTVRDDGVGFDVAKARARAIHGGSMGLLGMEERVSLMGGELEIVSMPTMGTTVRARFAVTPREREA